MEKKSKGVMVKVLYAPSKREFSDDLHNNIACSFEVMVLETLLENNDLEVFYLPHAQSSKKVLEAIKSIFGDSIRWVKKLPKNIDVLVSDTSNRVYEHALSTHNPSILCLFGFNGIQYPPNDKYYSMLENFSHGVSSLQELKEVFLKYDLIKQVKKEKIQEFFNGVVL